jgi:hypothetical protein
MTMAQDNTLLSFYLSVHNDPLYLNDEYPLKTKLGKRKKRNRLIEKIS